MSFDKIEVRVFSGPDQVQVGSNTKPDLVVINIGPKGDTGATGNTGATGPAGPNSVTSATTSDGSCALSVFSVTANGIVNTIGAESLIQTSGANAYITTSGADASIYTSGADASIYTEGLNAYIQSRSTFKIHDGTYTTTLSGTQTADRAIAFPNASGTVSLIANTETLTNKTLTSPTINSATFGTATTFNTTSYTYGTGAAAAHRTALGLDSLFNDKANLSGGNSFSGAQTIATTGAAAALALSTTSTSSSIVLETALAASATGTTSIAIGRALTTNNAAIFGHGASYAYAHVQGRTAADFNVQSSGNVCIGTTTDNNAFGGAKLQVRGQGSSTANWRGRIVAGGDNAVFLMGEYNSGAWLGAHNGSLSAWADMYIQAQGGKDLCIAYDGASFYANSRIITGATIAMGTASPNARALIDMTSTTKGFLPPRMNTTQRDAISSPPAGLMIYNTTTNKLNVFTTAWEQVTSA